VAEPTDAETSEKVRLINYIFPIAILVLLVGGYLFFTNQSTTGQAVTPVGEQNSSKNGTVMYFYSEACHYCQQEKPIVERLENESYNITWMDVGIHPDYWQTYGIQGTPTFLASNGERHAGFLEYDALKAWLDQHGAKAI
jgi:thioredoxin-like negative regulator of GroEL